MGRYGSHVEQTYRNAFGLKKSKCIDWLKLNVSLAKRFFGKQGRWAIAIDPSYISKAGKKTPHIGRFWSGCAQSVKHGLEIMGIGLIDIDAKDCMMLKAHQSLSNKELSLRNKTMVDFYISVIKRYRTAHSSWNSSWSAHTVPCAWRENDCRQSGHYQNNSQAFSLAPYSGKA